MSWQWWVLVVVVVEHSLLPRGGAKPHVMQMMRDVITHKHWDYVTFLYTEKNGKFFLSSQLPSWVIHTALKF